MSTSTPSDAPMEDAPVATSTTAAVPIATQGEVVATAVAVAPKRKYNVKSPAFNDMLFEIMLFRSRTGHTRVPSSMGALYRWVVQMRSAKRNQDTAAMSQDQELVLNSIDFVWDVTHHDRQTKWNEHYQQLEAYKSQHGHVNVPQSTALGKWVKTQRENYHAQKKGPRRSGKPYISQERIELLERLNFQWTINPPIVGWETRFQALQEYRQVHGNPHVPQGYKPNVPLGRWVMKQRSQYSLRRRGLKNQLTDERIQRLESLGFKWTCNKNKEEEVQT